MRDAPDVLAPVVQADQAQIGQSEGSIGHPGAREVECPEARSLGLQVIVWTVNAPAGIAAMLDLGVDGIISDRPDLVREEMKRRGLRLPPATPVQSSQ